MAITRIGSVAQVDLPNGDSGSVSMTVQSGCDFFLICGVAWDNAAGMFTLGTFTLDGQAVSVGVAGDVSSSTYYAAMLYRLSPASGSKTFAWTFQTGGGPASGNCGVWAYASYSGVDQVSPIRDSDFEQDNSATLDIPALTVVTDDLVVAWIGKYAVADRTYSFANATNVFDVTRSLPDGDGALAEATPTTGTVAISATQNTGIEDGSICGLVLKPAVGTPDTYTLAPHNVSPLRA